MAARNITETVEQLLIPVTEAQGVELYDLEYVKEGGDMVLRLYIDKDGGVDLNDCERVSCAAEAALDASDPIPAAYLLEVSSPGIERKLKKDNHFARYAGEKVEVRLFAPLDGRKKFKGILQGIDGGVVTVAGGDEHVFKFERSKISSCRLIVFE
jgi:ribosome maturation factor RimP